MENDNLIFQNSISYNRLPDEITRKAVKEFVLTQNDYPNKKQCLSYLCRRYPRNLSVEKFTSKDLLDTISIWGEPIYRKCFLRFVIFAILNKYNNDPILQRLAEHEDCLNTLSNSLEYIEYEMYFICFFALKFICFRTLNYYFRLLYSYFKSILL